MVEDTENLSGENSNYFSLCPLYLKDLLSMLENVYLQVLQNINKIGGKLKTESYDNNLAGTVC